MLRKSIIALTSIIKIMKAYIFTKGKLKSTFYNSIKGKLMIQIKGKGSISIKKFLMSQGPLYLKSVEGGKIEIGNNVFFNHNCSITAVKKIVIGNSCMFANNLVIVDHDHVVDEKGVTSNLMAEAVIIGDRVWCGANVTITKGVHIGQGAVIGANSVIVHDVEEYSVVAGTPAKVIKHC